MKEGSWIVCDDNGHLLSKDNYKNDKKENLWDKFCWKFSMMEGKLVIKL